MEARGLTQTELARRLRVTQGAIAKIVKNNPGGSSHLHRIARELGTTPAYLVGETDDPDADAPVAVPLEPEARELVDHFAGLSAADRRALLQVARSMAGGPPAGETVHSKKVEFRGPHPHGS